MSMKNLFKQLRLIGNGAIPLWKISQLRGGYLEVTEIIWFNGMESGNRDKGILFSDGFRTTV